MEKNQFGELFHHDKYKDDAMLLRHTLYELADHLGHSLENHLSLNLLCLGFMIPYETCATISIALSKLLYENKINQENVFEMVEKTMIEHFPEAEEFGDLSIRAFTKAFAKCLITELQPLIPE